MIDDLDKIRALIEAYDVGLLEADEPAIYWAVKTLIDEHESLTKTAEQSDSALALAAAQNQRLTTALEQIANRDDREMAVARTLHYDMRGWALAALASEEPALALPAHNPKEAL